MQCDSKGPGFPCPLIGHRLFDEAIKLSRCRISLDLTIPHLSVELGEPLPELREFLGGKALDEKFEFFDCAHAGSCFTTSNNCTPTSHITLFTQCTEPDPHGTTLCCGLAPSGGADDDARHSIRCGRVPLSTMACIIAAIVLISLNKAGNCAKAIAARL